MSQVAVVIPVWNGRTILGRCLDALERQTLPRERFDIIVVDNGSTDGTADIARGYANVTVLEEPTPGSYAARNTALADVRAPITAFTDADCIPDPDWLVRVLEAAAAACFAKADQASCCRDCSHPAIMTGRRRFASGTVRL